MFVKLGEDLMVTVEANIPVTDIPALMRRLHDVVLEAQNREIEQSPDYQRMMGYQPNA